MSNYFSAEFTTEQQQRVVDLIAQLKNELSFCIKLTNSQKKAMAALDDVRLPFAEKGIAFGKQEPRIVPPFTELDEYGRDLQVFSNMGPVENELRSLTEMVSDSRMAAGADAYQAALSIYASLKGAIKNGIPGTKAMYDEMKKLFSGNGPGKKADLNAG